jgi:hypothetical protein
MATEKVLFKGPDPPMVRYVPTAEELEAIEKEKAAAAKAKKGEESVMEAPKDPQEEAEDKMYEEFAGTMVEKISSLASDLASFRSMCHPETGLKKIPLYPKVVNLK